jgi:cell division protein FtsN
MKAMSARGVTVISQKTKNLKVASPLISRANVAAAKLALRPVPKPNVPSALDVIDTVKAQRGSTLNSSAAQRMSLTKPTASSAMAANGKYAVQVGAFRETENAGDMMLHLAKSGYQGKIIERPDTKRQIWCVVWAGQFEGKGSVSRLVGRLKKQGLSAFVVSTKQSAN